MAKFRQANPCQNKKSKQKKHDKRDKRNANECLFNTSLCSETWQPPPPPGGGGGGGTRLIRYTGVCR